MESVVLDEDRLVSDSDASITENTRGVLGTTKKAARSQIPPTSPIG
jgi:ATP-dependent phosphoenolpyruvate carboxykinase